MGGRFRPEYLAVFTGMIDDIYKSRITTIRIPGFLERILINYPSILNENGGLDGYGSTGQEINGVDESVIYTFNYSL